MALVVKNLLATARDIETWIWSLGWEDPLEESKETILVFLPGESHGKKSLVGYGAEGHKKESDTTEVT